MANRKPGLVEFVIVYDTLSFLTYVVFGYMTGSTLSFGVGWILLFLVVLTVSGGVWYWLMRGHL